MIIRLIALDLDGTTLKKNHLSTSAGNRRAITAALKSGITVVPATGRYLSVMPSSIKKLAGIRYVITSNGACITDINRGIQIYSNPIPAEQALQILDKAKEHNIFTEVYCEGRAYAEPGKKPAFVRKNPFFLILSILRKCEKVPDISVFVREYGKSIEKIELFADDAKKKEEIESELRGLNMTVTTSGMNSVEITNFGANKGSALAHLCEHLQVKQAEVMAIGDNCNDIEMLKWSGLAVAVENADNALKQIADFVTLSSDKDGVANAIKQFALDLKN